MRLTLFFLLYAFLFLAVKTVWQLTGDFLLLGVIYLGFFLEKGRRGVQVAAGFGFLVDVVSAVPVGATMTGYLAVFGLIRALRSRIFFQGVLSRFVWTALFSLAADGCATLWSLLAGVDPRPIAALLFPFGWNALVNALLGLFWFYFLDWCWEPWILNKISYRS